MIQNHAANEIAERFAALRGRFVGDLPSRLRMILRSLQQAGRDGADASDLERLFHTVAGTAATFGLTAVAALALEAEEVCAGGCADEPTRAYLAMVIADMERLSEGVAVRSDAA